MPCLLDLDEWIGFRTGRAEAGVITEAHGGVFDEKNGDCQKHCHGPCFCSRSVSQKLDGSNTGGECKQNDGKADLKFDGAGDEHGVHGNRNFAASIGVRTAGFNRAVIAGVGGCAITNDSLFVIHFGADQRHAGWALPDIPVGIEAEAAGMETLGAILRVARHAFEREGDQHQQDDICAREQRFQTESSDHRPAVDSVTSANKIVFGSWSVVSRRTLWRTASQQRYSKGSTPPKMKTASPGKRSHSMSALTGLPMNLSERASK